MNIIHLEASTGWGGQEMRILKEAEGMREKGHAVLLVVVSKGALVERARQKGFVVYECSFKKLSWFWTLPFLCFVFLKNNIDVVNTHSSLDGWIGGIAARLCRIPVVRTRHLSTPIKPGLNSRLLYGKLADFVVTTCEKIVPMIVAQSGKSQKCVRSIATGVDPEKIQCDRGEAEKFRESIGVLPTDFLVGTACFMRSWKGIYDFLQAADLLREVKGFKWVVIGGGHAEIHKAQAKKLNLEGIVHFTGHLEQPFPALLALDAFALLSTANEGVSQAILQAAFLKKPLVATNTGGLCEVCVQGVTGFLVPPFHPEEVARAVRALHENRALCEMFGQSAHRLVSEKFIVGQTIDQMLTVYNSVVN